jgi:putative transcriptional regulator
MSRIKAIRERLKLTQAEFGVGIGCSQGNVWQMENGQTVLPETARRIIAFAKTKGIDLTWDDVYGEPSESAEKRAA